MKFRSIGNDYSSGCKPLVKTTYRRALDPSENGKPRGRFEISMPNGSQNRRVEIPIGWPVGKKAKLYAIDVRRRKKNHFFYMNERFVFFSPFLSPNKFY